MLVTDKFVFLHIPKTGGSFIQHAVVDHLLVEDYRPWTHTPYRDLPARWRHLAVFCVVRNPWDWYVSWFHYAMERGREKGERLLSPSAPQRKRVIWEDVLRLGRADFKEAVTRACTGDFDHPLAPMIRDEGVDLYSAFIRDIAGAALERSDFTPLRFERLRKQLLQYLRSRIEVPGPLARAIRCDPPRRVSDHGPYADYYDSDLRELVGEKAGWLCERFNYRFDPAKSPPRARAAR